MERFSAQFREKYPHKDHLDGIENAYDRLVQMRREYIHFPDVVPELREIGKVPRNPINVLVLMQTAIRRAIELADAMIRDANAFSYTPVWVNSRSLIRKAGQSDPLLRTLSRPEPRSGRGSLWPAGTHEQLQIAPDKRGANQRLRKRQILERRVERTVERSPGHRVLPGVRSKACASTAQNPATFARGSWTICRRRSEPESRPISAAEVHVVSRAK